SPVAPRSTLANNPLQRKEKNLTMKPLDRSLRFRLAAAALLALCSALPTRADYSSTVLSQGPVGYWRLNETIQPFLIGGATNQGSLGSAIIGTYNNFPTRGLTGPFSGSTALGVDGSSQSVTTPYNSALNTTNAFSVEL